MNINMDVFMESLVVMAKGMSGIFIVMFIIFLAIKGLGHLFKGEE
jgi:Na+-transporting methylmalonyl-CoA/oxaloacetate decarboxylase gamma subunit